VAVVIAGRDRKRDHAYGLRDPSGLLHNASHLSSGRSEGETSTRRRRVDDHSGRQPNDSDSPAASRSRPPKPCQRQVAEAVAVQDESAAEG
jgi:hypothetical protein